MASVCEGDLQTMNVYPLKDSNGVIQFDLRNCMIVTGGKS